MPDVLVLFDASFSSLLPLAVPLHKSVEVALLDTLPRSLRDQLPAASDVLVPNLNASVKFDRLRLRCCQ